MSIHSLGGANSLPSNASSEAPAVKEAPQPDKSGKGTELAAYTAADLFQKPKYELTISEEAVKKAIDKANRQIIGPPKRFEYSVHKSSGIISVKVVNSDTNEVIREIPPEKLLDIVDKLIEISGMIIDEKR